MDARLTVMYLNNELNTCVICIKPFIFKTTFKHNNRIYIL